MTIFDRLEAQLLDAHPHRSRRAVLNATTKPGLARDAAYALQRHGWKIGTVSNYTDRTLDASAVDFVPGRSAAASLIAKELGIYNVVPATRLVTALAGPKAGVIVIVGRNRAGG